MRRTEGKYTSKRREIERMNNVKGELISFLNDDTNAASLLDYSVCRNSTILDDVCEGTNVDLCKEMVNELIANVLTINYKFERVLVDAIIRALKTSSSHTLSVEGRRANFFKSVCKIISSNCAEMIDSNMKKCSYIVNRYLDIDNDTMFNLFVYAIMVQYTYATLHKNKKDNDDRHGYYLHFDKNDKVESDLYDKTVLSNLEHRRNKRKQNNNDVAIQTNSPSLINTMGVIYLPESSKMLRHKTVINASDDDKQVGNYRPTDNAHMSNCNYRKVHNRENHNDYNENQESNDTTNRARRYKSMSMDDLIKVIDELVRESEVEDIIELETIKFILNRFISKESKKELMESLCRVLPSKFGIDHSVVGHYIYFNTFIINKLYNMTGINDDDISFIKRVIDIIDERISVYKNRNKSINTNTEGAKSNDKPNHKSTLEAFMNKSSECKDEIDSNNTKSEGTKTNDKPNHKSTLEAWMDRVNSSNHNGKFSKIVKEYKGNIDLSNVMNELVLELDSIGALDVIDDTLDKLQINMDELAYVLFALTNKNALSNKLRKEVYSVFIKNVIGGHKHKDRIMDVVVNTLLTNKGTHSVSDLHPYTSDVKIEPLDETINLSMRLMKCKLEDIAC